MVLVGVAAQDYVSFDSSNGATPDLASSQGAVESNEKDTLDRTSVIATDVEFLLTVA